MTTAQNETAGSGMFSKLVVVLLLALAIALYLKIVMVGGERQSGERPPQASVRVIESHPTAQQSSAATALRDLPAHQMDLIKQVFAPEMSQ